MSLWQKLSLTVCRTSMHAMPGIALDITCRATCIERSRQISQLPCLLVPSNRIVVMTELGIDMPCCLCV